MQKKPIIEPLRCEEPDIEKRSTVLDGKWTCRNGNMLLAIRGKRIYEIFGVPEILYTYKDSSQTNVSEIKPMTVSTTNQSYTEGNTSIQSFASTSHSNQTQIQRNYNSVNCSKPGVISMDFKSPINTNEYLSFTLKPKNYKGQACYYETAKWVLEGISNGKQFKVTRPEDNCMIEINGEESETQKGRIVCYNVSIETDEREEITYETIEAEIEENQAHQASPISAEQAVPIESEPVTQTFGCFTHDGSWTQNRSKCDPNQQSHYVKIRETTNRQSAAEVVPEEIIHTMIVESAPRKLTAEEEVIVVKHMNEKYIRSNKYQSKRGSLVKSIEEVKDKISAIRERRDLPEHVDLFMERSIGWLNGQHSYIKLQEPSQEEMQFLSQYLRQLIGSVEKLLSDLPDGQHKAAPIKIEDIYARAGRIIEVFPEIVSLLWQEGVEVEKGTVDAYFQMRNEFLVLWEKCKIDNSVCDNLESILDQYEIIKDRVEDSLGKARRNDLRETVDGMMG